jgi:hypothetical protein
MLLNGVLTQLLSAIAQIALGVGLIDTSWVFMVARGPILAGDRPELRQ